MTQSPLMRPAVPASAAAWPAGEQRRLVRSAEPHRNRRSAVQTRSFMPAIPPPPRVPRDLEEMLDDALGSSRVQVVFDTLPAEDDDDLAAVLPSVPARDRITEFQQNGNRLLEETRAARRERDKAKLEADVWRERAFAFAQALRRLDPAWEPT